MPLRCAACLQPLLARLREAWGGGPRTAGSRRPRSPAGSRLVAHVKVVPYGVLGSSSSAGKVAPEPDAETVFVDPAGLHYIRGGPGGAGGAAGAIYGWLGIASAPAFPQEVRASLTRSLQAKFHAYGSSGEKKCIHVVGPDFRTGVATCCTRPYTREEAEAELAEAYFNVFREFHASGLRRLRLLPISGGIFSGSFGGEIPQLTADALAAGFARLDEDVQAWVLRADLELCVFDSRVAGFRSAFGEREQTACQDAFEQEQSASRL